MVRATSAAPKNVSRSRNDTSCLAQAVTEAAHRLDQPGLTGAVQLASQVADVDGDHVVIRLLASPHGAEQLFARQHQPRMPKKVSQQRELPRRELHGPLAAPDLAGFDLQRQVRKLQNGRRRWGATQQRAYAGEQLCVCKR